MKTYLLCLGLILVFFVSSQVQRLKARDIFNNSISLRSQFTPLRTCYDIKYNNLSIKVDIDKKFIPGTNIFHFAATEDFSKLQFDLFDNLSDGKPFTAIACQGWGASVWCPNKDLQSDEVDNMKISVSIPPGRINGSNGRFIRNLEIKFNKEGRVNTRWVSDISHFATPNTSRYCKPTFVTYPP